MKEVSVTSPNIAASLQATSTLSIRVSRGTFSARFQALLPQPRSLISLDRRPRGSLQVSPPLNGGGGGPGRGGSLYTPPPHSRGATAVRRWGVGNQLLLPREKPRTLGHRTLKSAPFTANPWGRAALPRLGPSPETARGASPPGTAWV